MGTTNFPQGVSSYGVPVLPSAGGQVLTNGVIFVDTVNGVDAGTGNGPSNPYQTLTYAISQAAANSTIYVMPGSAIVVSSATALVIATAGLQIIGLGNENARPTITLNTANTATIAVNAANVRIQNFVVIGNFLSIAAAITLTTATGFTLVGNEFRDAGATLNFLNIVKSTGAANTVDELYVQGNTWNGLGTTSVNAFILTANDVDNAQIFGNTVILNRTVDQSILLVVTAGVLTNLQMGYNIAVSKQTATTAGSLINVTGTTSTGVVYNNYAATLTTTGDLIYTGTVGLYAFNNFVTGVLASSGWLRPVADS